MISLSPRELLIQWKTVGMKGHPKSRSMGRMGKPNQIEFYNLPEAWECETNIILLHIIMWPMLDMIYSRGIPQMAWEIMWMY